MRRTTAYHVFKEYGINNERKRKSAKLDRKGFSSGINKKEEVGEVGQASRQG